MNSSEIAGSENLDLSRRHWLLQIGEGGDGLRLDQAIAADIDGLSRTVVRRIIEIGGVHLNGRRTRKCGHQVRCGDTVEVYCDGLPLTPFVLEEGAILFRDRYLLAVDKPAGIETQPTPARYQGTLYQALQAYLRNPFRPHDRPAIGMVQRLDRDTSGILVFSIHPRSHRELTRQFASREVEKTYLALVLGSPPEAAGEIRSRLVRSRHGNRMIEVTTGGKDAVTSYRLLRQGRRMALLEVKILTGRTHQIRVQLAGIGCPLLGDELYGPPAARDDRWPRQMLHSWRLRLIHPVDKVSLTLEAPLPADFSAALDPDISFPEDSSC